MRRYIIFSIAGLALLLSSIGSSTASVAFPALTSDLNTSLVVAGWVLTIYQLVSTAVLAVAGKTSEIWGSRIAFAVHTLFFLVGSILCAVSPNIYLLIGSRVIQAIGGGGFLPCAAGIVSDEFPEARQRSIGLFSSIFPFGMIIGPNLGGWMVESFGWRSIFWFNVPLAIAVLALSLFLMPAGSKSNARISVDFTGAGLLFGSLSTFVLGLTELGNSKSGTPLTLAIILLMLGVALMVAFALWERRTKEPIIDLELLRRKPFLAANLYNLIYGVFALGVFSLIPLYAVSIYQMSILQSGFILTPRSVGMMIASAVTSFFLVRWGYRRPVLGGTLAVAAGLMLLSLKLESIEIMGFPIGSTPLLLAIMGLCGIGHGICTPAANNACIELAPDKVAMISGLRGMFRNLGSGLGIAITTVLLHTIGDLERAFQIVFFASALILLLLVPIIFAMPASPNVSTSREQPVKLEST